MEIQRSEGVFKEEFELDKALIQSLAPSTAAPPSQAAAPAPMRSQPAWMKGKGSTTPAGQPARNSGGFQVPLPSRCHEEVLKSVDQYTWRNQLCVYKIQRLKSSPGHKAVQHIAFFNSLWATKSKSQPQGFVLLCPSVCWEPKRTHVTHRMCRLRCSSGSQMLRQETIADLCMTQYSKHRCISRRLMLWCQQLRVSGLKSLLKFNPLLRESSTEQVA